MVQYIDSIPCFPFEPNWSSPVRYEMNYKTDIFTSSEGQEDRSSQREFAKETYRMLFSGRKGKPQEIRSFIIKHQGLSVLFPNPVTKMKVYSSGLNYLTLSDNPSWAYSGKIIVLKASNILYFRKIISVFNGIIRYEGNTVVNPDTAMEGFQGEMVSSQKIESLTSKVSSFNCTIRRNHDSYTVKKRWSGFNFRGIPVFPFEPNWSGSLTEDIVRDVKELDYGYGPVSMYSPQSEASWAGSMSFTARDRTVADNVISFFDLMKGRRGSFYCDNWYSAFSVIGNDSSSVLVEGSYADDMLSGSRKFQTFRLKLTSGGEILTTVIETIDNGETTTIVFDCDLGFGTVREISFLTLVRFSSDTLTIDWLTDQKAQFQLGITTVFDVFGALRIADKRLSVGGDYVTIKPQKSEYLDPISIEDNTLFIGEQTLQ